MTTVTSELGTLRSAIEARDAEGVTAHYAADATLTLLDREHPPSRPAVFRGRSAIEGYYRDICSRNLDHSVGDVVSTGDRFSFVQRCQYPSGERVVCLTTAEVDAEGLITAQLGVQVWDA